MFIHFYFGEMSVDADWRACLCRTHNKKMAKRNSLSHSPDFAMTFQ